MKVSSFISHFKNHTLGKSRSCGSYRVLEGACCQVLVKARKYYNTPAGSDLIAITFTPELTFFAHGYYNIRNTTRYEVVGQCFKVSSSFLNGGCDNLLDSGIIDVDTESRKMLIEIGDTPWLLEYEKVMAEISVGPYHTASKLSIRCSSISEALDMLKPDKDTVTALGWEFRKMPNNWEPMYCSDEDRQILRTSPNPMDFGFEIEHCRERVVTNSSNTMGVNTLGLKTIYKDDPNAQLYMDAVQRWGKALERYRNAFPSMFNSQLSPVESGLLVYQADDNSYYVKGCIKEYYGSNKATFAGWHRIEQKSTKMRLAA